MHTFHKYKPFPPVPLPTRRWPNQTVTHAPAWCSVDLRDGNQALPTPMNVAQKLALWETLIAIGFTQIEVGYPAAGPLEVEFIRHIIDERRIPQGVAIQVITPCRRPHIATTLAAVRGASEVIIHLYNSTSPAQRQYVFGATREQTIALAVSGVHDVREAATPLIAAGTRVQLQYSPESFNSTELPFALQICEAVCDAWGATASNPVILNLPATVEYASPNTYADQIEWMATHLRDPRRATLSAHAHNDRGCAVAATELAMMAGATRVEGTLFGNGERTGNVDLVTVALNLHTHGIDCGLDFSHLPAIRRSYEHATGMTVHPRHPYAGDLVFTAFSGTHQDAIRKSWGRNVEAWDTLYIPTDPTDLGRTYEPVRINSQSGKGGAAFVLEHHFGIILPKSDLPTLGAAVGELTDRENRELTPHEILAIYQQKFSAPATEISQPDLV